MPRHRHSLRGTAAALAASAVGFLTSSGAAQAIARTPRISGNSWVALLIIGGLVATIYMLIRGTLHVEQRDARLGGRRSRDDGWFGIFPHGTGDDEDAPDHLHHDGGEGGEGGEGGFWS